MISLAFIQQKLPRTSTGIGAMLLAECTVGAGSQSATNSQ